MQSGQSNAGGIGNGDMTTVLFFSDIPWTGLHQRPQHIALALAKHWTVLWIEPTTIGNRNRYTPVNVAPQIYTLSLPVIPYNARLSWIQTVARFIGGIRPFRTILTRVQQFLLRKALRRISATEVIAVIENFHVTDAMLMLSPRLVLYDYIDNAFGFSAVPDHIRDLWETTVRKADIITVTSPKLAEQIKPFRTENVFHVGNGVEYSRFAGASASPRPVDLPSGKPVVGYIGAVYPWLDYRLLEDVCRMLNDVNFVFIGPIHPKVHQDAESFFRLPNVVTLGFRPYDTLPLYLRHFNAGMIPFQINDLTRSVNPVKLYEYSAAGIPTVTTPFSDDVTGYEGIISCAGTPAGFASALRIAITASADPGTAARLQEFARVHDWTTITDRIVTLIETSLSHPHAT
jgi:teichuronic acid biosynthesis glycosyltransferase TuaH